MTDEIVPFVYSDGKTPNGYRCDVCGATGVRLYRRYQSFLENQKLHCTCCAIANINLIHQYWPPES